MLALADALAGQAFVTTTAPTLGQRQPCFACYGGARRAARQRVSRLPGGGVAL